MAFFSESLALSESAFLLLRELIREKTGIFFEETKRDMLADKLSNRVIERGFNSFLDYYYFLKYDPETVEEWKIALNLITVNETYFWREYDHLNALVTHIVPEHVKNHPGKPLRIWSAACSSGEEPLSILMALDIHGWLDKIKVDVIASDASDRALQKAKQGLYGERSFRSLPAEIRDRYFTQENNLWRIDPGIHKRVTWKSINLVSMEEVRQIFLLSVIFCRNVFIYFREDAIRKVVDQFYSQLTPSGYLIVGVSESLFKLTSQFELSEVEKTFIYKKVT